jgi:hypothetical protein
MREWYIYVYMYVYQWCALVIGHDRKYRPKQSGLNYLVEAKPILRFI